ncbi:hypothetical protein VN11_17620 [Stenotrophomonas maltophilia]|nr:hypothetical protein VN11_17620 [Stenotrophomonas maltophilia]
MMKRLRRAASELRSVTLHMQRQQRMELLRLVAIREPRQRTQFRWDERHGFRRVPAAVLHWDPAP